MNLLRASKRIGIGIRLAIMVAVLMVAVPGSFMAISLVSQRREMMDMFVSSSIQMGHALERILRLSMSENRRDEIESAVDQIAITSTITAVTLVTHTGEPAYSSRPEQEASVSRADMRCSGCHEDNGGQPLERLPKNAGVIVRKESKSVEIILPIYNDPDCSAAECHAHSESETVLGVMQLDLSYAEIDASLALSHRKLITYLSMVTLGTFIAILLLIRRWVTNPVRIMLEGTRRVADGDLDYAIPVGEAELGILAQAFNKMQGDLKSSRKQLIATEKFASIGKLAASVAHEINNPLTGILVFAEDLVEQSDPDDPKIEDYETIKHEAIRCREIVRQLLDFSRRDSPYLKPQDMNEILTRMVNFVSRQAIFRNIEIKTDLMPGLPRVVADSTQLSQVILGLLVNASEAMSEKGDIHITSSVIDGDENIEVAIRDSGPGIAKEHLDRIFEPFFSTKGERSLGIGLAVSLNIINQHNGRLEADSESGKGTTFRIVMPCAKGGGHAGGDDGPAR